MPTARSHNAIDFLKPNASRDYRLTLLVNWALLYGRIILITTEALVIAVFAARLVLDEQIADEREVLTRQQNIVASLASTETTFRTLQKRIVLTKNLLAKQRDPTPVLQATLDLVPEGVTLSSFGFADNGTVAVSGVAANPESFQQFYRNLSSSRVLTNITVGTVSFGRDGISFSATAQSGKGQ